MTDLSRAELLGRGAEEYAAVIELVARMRADGRADEAFAGDARDRSIRDVLAHLHAWHELLERWHREGMGGGAPAIPAEGYTWRELDALNDAIRDDAASESLDDVLRMLDASHTRLEHVLQSHSDAELADASAFSWTQGSPLGEFFLETGGNHYAWARQAITDGLGL